MVEASNLGVSGVEPNFVLRSNCQLHLHGKTTRQESFIGVHQCLGLTVHVKATRRNL